MVAKMTPSSKAQRSRPASQPQGGMGQRGRDIARTDIASTTSRSA